MTNNPTPADAEKLDNFEHLLLFYEIDNVSVRLKLEGGSITPEEAEARYKEVQDSLCEKVAALIDAARIDERNMMSKAFYEADRDEIPMEQIYAQHLDRIAQLSHPAPVHKSDKEYEVIADFTDLPGNGIDADELLDALDKSDKELD